MATCVTSYSMKRTHDFTQGPLSLLMLYQLTKEAILFACVCDFSPLGCLEGLTSNQSTNKHWASRSNYRQEHMDWSPLTLKI